MHLIMEFKKQYLGKITGQRKKIWDLSFTHTHMQVCMDIYINMYFDK